MRNKWIICPFCKGKTRVKIREDTDFCRRRESDQTYMDKLFIPIQGCLLEVVLRLGITQSVVNKRKAKILAKLRKIMES